VTKGSDWVDPRFDENWQGAREAGLEVGAYRFFRTCTDGALQAANVLDTVPADGDIPIAIDVEGGGICGDDVSEEMLRKELIEMMELVEAERGPVIFYVLAGFDHLGDVFETRPK
jgi:lysozyme